MTDTGPAAFVGTPLKVIWLSLSTVKQGDAGHGVLKLTSVEPKFTSVAPVKLVPARITLPPPAIGPPVGVRLVNVGAMSGASGLPEVTRKFLPGLITWGVEPPMVVGDAPRVLTRARAA